MGAIQQRKRPWTCIRNGKVEVTRDSPWRGDGQGKVKYWVLAGHQQSHPNGERFKALFSSSVSWRSGHGKSLWTLPMASRRWKMTFVLAMTGYHPDVDFLQKMGIRDWIWTPVFPNTNPQTLETNKKGLSIWPDRSWPAR